MVKKYLLIALLATLSLQAFATSPEALKNPAKGVLCDMYLCTDQNGVSTSLTLKYLGKKREAALSAQGAFDKSAFTFSNGVFCDTKEKQCHTDRYFDKDGKRSPVAVKENQLLFSGEDSQ